MKKNWSFKITIFMIILIAFAACKPKQVKHDKNATEESIYTCPMHPQIIKDRPGNCPICGMTLQKKTVVASEDSIVPGNVLKAVNETVVANIKTVYPQRKKISRELEATGFVSYDTRRFHTVSARAAGRIEKLYVKYQFQPVHKGQKLYEIYSPELVTAQEEYLYLLKNDPSNTATIAQARQNLLNLGMNAQQLNEIAKSGKADYSLSYYCPYDGYVVDAQEMNKPQSTGMNAAPVRDYLQDLSTREGMYVQMGQEIFRIMNTNTVWAVLKFLPEDAASVKKGQQVNLTADKANDRHIHGKIDLVQPFFNDNKSLPAVTVRVYLANADGFLKIGDLLHASLKTGREETLTIPSSAVVDLGLRKVAFVKKGNVFEAREIKTGSAEDDVVTVFAGLQDTEAVASNAQYLVDSEGFIKTK